MSHPDTDTENTEAVANEETAADAPATEPTEKEIVYPFIEDLISNDKSEDDILTAVAEKTGKGIIAALRLYKQFLKDTGRTLSPDDRKLKIIAIIEESSVTAQDEDDEDVVSIINLDAVVERVIVELDLAKSTALANIRKICEAKNISLPVVEKAGGEVTTWLIEHPNTTRDEFSKWMESEGKKKTTTATYWSMMLFSRKCFTAWKA